MVLYILAVRERQRRHAVIDPIREKNRCMTSAAKRRRKSLYMLHIHILPPFPSILLYLNDTRCAHCVLSTTSYPAYQTYYPHNRGFNRALLLLLLMHLRTTLTVPLPLPLTYATYRFLHTLSVRHTPPAGNKHFFVLALSVMRIAVGFSLLEVLMTTDHPISVHFRANIRRFNNALAFTSIAMDKDLSAYGQLGQMTIRATGKIGHWRGAFAPDEGGERNFAQIYLLDRDDAAEARLLRQAIVQGRAVPGLDAGIMGALTDYMKANNAYAHIYRTAQARFNDSPQATAVRIRQVQGG